MRRSVGAVPVVILLGADSPSKGPSAPVSTRRHQGARRRSHLCSSVILPRIGVYERTHGNGSLSLPTRGPPPGPPAPPRPGSWTSTRRASTPILLATSTPTLECAVPALTSSRRCVYLKGTVDETLFFNPFLPTFFLPFYLMNYSLFVYFLFYYFCLPYYANVARNWLLRTY